VTGARPTFGGKAGAAALAAALLAMFCAAPSQAANKNPPTIKDLDAQQVDVNTDPPRNVDANKTMESYKRFLDLNAGDAALRSEALRRLGDLNLESSESERIERELITNEGLRATEAIHLYSALLKTYPKYERNDSVLYQLARAYELNAQPDKALASLDQMVATYPNSHYIDEAQFRRGELLFSNKVYPKAQNAYEAVIKIGSSAFSGCGGLTNVTLDNVTNIAYGAFSGCLGLTNVTLGSHVTSIGFWGFASCTSLTDVTDTAFVASVASKMTLEAFTLSPRITLVKTRGTKYIRRPEVKRSIPPNVWIMPHRLFNTVNECMPLTGANEFDGYAGGEFEGYAMLMI